MAEVIGEAKNILIVGGGAVGVELAGQPIFLNRNRNFGAGIFQ